ncbi:DUF922 domain-containing protein [Salinimonas iocasae]|uniref:DUF922 domain-containing protein n=1 Tax=Salinimonas iocasae TaxID=2572577 RepID=A0A5B7YJ46_9ALTE|nr:DUF922 domain-containing protein [Salinimonas iocasae]QCZ95584.1 DUF922 domain-containing protein [Salinimonas iocasae]
MINFKTTSSHSPFNVSKKLLCACAIYFTVFNVSGQSQLQGSHSFEYAYYSVTGVSGLDSIKSVVSRTAREHEMTTDALTSTSYKWKHLQAPAEKNGICTPSQVELKAHTVITLPRLVNAKLTKDELAVWAKSLKNLLSHENLHYANHQQAFLEITQEANSFEAPCNGFRAAFSKAMKVVIHGHIETDEAIDKKQSTSS